MVYLKDNTFVAAGEFIGHDTFKEFKVINVDDDEAYSANCIMMNDHLIIPKGFDLEFPPLSLFDELESLPLELSELEPPELEPTEPLEVLTIGDVPVGVLCCPLSIVVARATPPVR